MPDSSTPYCGALPDAGCALTGEDGDYLLETSTFADTGPLIEPDGGGVPLAIDMLTGLTWTAGSWPSTDWSKAVQTCAGLGSGWSLPTVVELVSLLDLGQAGRPLIAPTFPGPTSAGDYWTLDQPTTTSAAVVSFSSGVIALSPMTTGAAVARCVLPPQTLTPPSYVTIDAGPLPGVVAFTDTHTSFTWAYQTVAQAPTWSQALATCNALEQLDCSDWRLPSSKELATLMAFGPSPPTTQVYGLQSAWTSSASPTTSGDYFLFATTGGDFPLVSPQSPSSPELNAWGSLCVRGP